MYGNLSMKITLSLTLTHPSPELTRTTTATNIESTQTHPSAFRNRTREGSLSEEGIQSLVDVQFFIGFRVNIWKSAAIHWYHLGSQ